MERQRTNRPSTLSLGAVAVSSALLLTACGSDDNPTGGGDGGSTAATEHISCDGEGQLLASGSSAQKNAMDVWIKQYTAACRAQVRYQPTGSGAGIQQFLQGRTGFAGSDSALREDEVARSKKVCNGGQGINLPLLGGPIAVGYNVPGVDELVLDAPTLAKIFDSKITKWDDAAIARLNPDADLPDLAIQPFHRSDESGTTDNLTAYLHAAAPEDWPHEPARTWAGKGGRAADGSLGVASQVKQTEGAIGYFELSYAQGNDIPTARLDTGADQPVEATVANASHAIAAGKIVGQGKDLAMELDYATQAEDAYPIVLVTYEIVCDRGNNATTRPLTTSFLGYAASEAGQQALTEIGYAPMPQEVIAKVRRTVAGLS